MRASVIGFGVLYAVTWIAALPFCSWPCLWSATAISAPLIWLSAVDLERFIIPDGAVLAIGLVGLAIVLRSGQPILPQIGFAAISFGGFWALGEVFFRIRGVEGLGTGDAKLLAAMTLCIGMERLWLVILLAALAGILSVLVSRHPAPSEDKGAVPFGPYLAYAFFLILLFSAEI